MNKMLMLVLVLADCEVGCADTGPSEDVLFAAVVAQRGCTALAIESRSAMFGLCNGRPGGKVSADCRLPGGTLENMRLVVCCPAGHCAVQP